MVTWLELGWVGGIVFVEKAGLGEGAEGDEGYSLSGHEFAYGRARFYELIVKGVGPALKNGGFYFGCDAEEVGAGIRGLALDADFAFFHEAIQGLDRVI